MWQSNCCSQDLRREFSQAVSIFAARDKVIKIVAAASFRVRTDFLSRSPSGKQSRSIYKAPTLAKDEHSSGNGLIMQLNQRLH